jgi:hypothetical protein
MTTEKKNKGGRPKGTTKADHEKGAILWVPAEFRAAMTTYLEFLKQNKQAKS